MKELLIMLLFVSPVASAFSQDMNNEKLEDIITRVADTVTGRDGQWQFALKDRIFLCITDVNNNRMRIISPITEVDNLSEEEILNSLVANFHTALDVKYAISEERIWAVFTHPLRELTDTQAESAIIQLYNAAATFGTIYSSTNLSFPGSAKSKESTPVKLKEPKLQKG